MQTHTQPYIYVYPSLVYDWITSALVIYHCRLIIRIIIVLLPIRLRLFRCTAMFSLILKSKGHSSLIPNCRIVQNVKYLYKYFFHVQISKYYVNNNKKEIMEIARQ